LPWDQRELLLRGDSALWKSCYLEILLESWIVPKVLEVELPGELRLLLLLLLLWLSLLTLRRKLLSRKLLLGLLTGRVSELVEWVSKLRWVEECVDAIDERLEEGSFCYQ